MILVTGGIYQGKRRFAETEILKRAAQPVPDGRILGADGEREDFAQAVLLTEFQWYIRRQVLAHVSMQELACDLEQLLEENPDVVITMSETGSGIVPMQKFERDWREAAGRAGVLLAKRADMVYRVMAGIGIRIK